MRVTMARTASEIQKDTVTPRVAARLVSELADQSGLACIHARQFGASTEARVTVEDVSARLEPGRRWWFKARRGAEKTLAELFSSNRVARRSRGGLLVEADLIGVDGMVRECAQRIGVAVHDDAAVQTSLDALTKRIETTVGRMRDTGALRPLSRAYAAEREAAKAAGTAAPARYEYWLAARLCATAQLLSGLPPLI